MARATSADRVLARSVWVCWRASLAATRWRSAALTACRADDTRACWACTWEFSDCTARSRSSSDAFRASIFLARSARLALAWSRRFRADDADSAPAGAAKATTSTATRPTSARWRVRVIGVGKSNDRSPLPGRQSSAEVNDEWRAVATRLKHDVAGF